MSEPFNVYPLKIYRDIDELDEHGNTQQEECIMFVSDEFVQRLRLLLKHNQNKIAHHESQN